MKKTLTYLLVLMVPAFLFVQCNTGTQKESSASKSVMEKVLSEQDFTPELEKILYEFPTPFEVTVMLEKAKAGFVFDLSNPAENLDKYMTESSKALNLGVYSADLSYAAAYNRSDEIKKLMECTGQLSDDLGILGIYNQNILTRIKNNYDQKDSLVNLISGIFNETKSLLSDNNRDKTTLLIVSGAFVETMYLATSLNLLTEDNEEITAIILNQKTNLEKLLQILDAFKADDEMLNLSQSLLPLKEFYDKNPDMATEEQAFDIKEIVESIRNTFI
ncbi:MAG: hypothetical protein CVU09_11605 [Bacteroidetes bacterium HGW-Bacteroidetes-4]|jgi:hypothetical protein|nr:MAG: hypothetical protein CVU09_11605 [Bacteroidetes bacterium HGW-Bacteroidetes-4]